MPTVNIMQLHEQLQTAGPRLFTTIYDRAVKEVKSHGAAYLKDMFLHACIGAASYGVINNSFAAKLSKKSGKFLKEASLELDNRLGKPTTPIGKTIKAVLSLIIRIL